MNLNNYYWYFKSAVPSRICDEIVKYGLSKAEIMARVGGYNSKKLSKTEINDMKRKRNSNVVWMDDAWIYKELQPFVDLANEHAGWNFNWERSESCQFTKYKINQYYDWHCDSYSLPYTEGNSKGMIRKLSMTCQLTDGSEYKGGELEFDFRQYDPHMRDESKHLQKATEILPKGSIIVFPSFVWHRVKPVTK